MIALEMMNHPGDGAGGRRSARAGEGQRPRETSPAQDLGTERPARGPSAPGGFDPERRRPPQPDRPADTARRRPPAPSSRLVNATETGPCLTLEQVNRATSHAVRGQRTGESAFGSDLFVPGGDWPDRDFEPLLEGDADRGADPTSSILTIRLRWPTQVRLDLNSDGGGGGGAGDGFATVLRTSVVLSRTHRGHGC